MNFKFPDAPELRSRRCFKCKKKIDFGEYYVRNKSVNLNRLIQLWQNNNIEYYCCLCYENFMDNRELKQLKDDLSEKDREIINIIEKKNRIKIPVVHKIDYNITGIIIKQEKIIELNLFKCVTYFPEEITMLTSLKSLSMIWNFLKIIPQSIVHLKSLENLYLIGNIFTSLPNEIGNLHNLRELDLSYNNLRTIPNSISELESLRILNLIGNNITVFPKPILELEKRGLKILF